MIITIQIKDHYEFSRRKCLIYLHIQHANTAAHRLLRKLGIAIIAQIVYGSLRYL